ncbi:hypothetical protein T12_10515 [Trichinella patagoniensis]|uniref:Uncharacterized protein n=1 Tax=Trichinella patagoniensis TaxID=990121 RepID=A0A0V0ZCX2_9BILA|nr:hypothetical protein T12_10515 [Trichinella patagoniensis]
MPSGKRETERKGNTPVNTGPSPNSDGRANNLVEEADEPARGSGPLQRLLILKLLLETGGTVIPVPADQQCGIFENGISPPVNTIRFYKSYRVRVRFGVYRSVF